ncbi:MAG: NADP transhydrogenase subunit alpha [Nitrososphaeria archaeon]|nr:NADP transhydrogenase subunit alpha [Nitrososphaeria archaeon]
MNSKVNSDISPSKELVFAVLGAGSAGHAMSAGLALKGFEVRLYDLPQFSDNIEPIQKRGGIEVSGIERGFAKLKATTDVREAIEGADIIMTTARAYGHRKFLEACIPYLENEQKFVINTGYWACLRLRDIFRQTRKEVLFAETTLLIYAGMRTGPAAVSIDGMKTEMKVAAYPATNTKKVVEALRRAFPQFTPAANVLETSLGNFNPVFHVPIALMNIGTIERTKGKFKFYRDGATPFVARVMDSVDNERLAVAEGLGLNLPSATEIMKKYYQAKGETTYDAFQSCEAYKEYILPNIFDYITEDVAYGLVPAASLGALLDVPTPSCKANISLWSLINKVNYWQTGITTKKLGIVGLDAQEIVELATKGE